VLHKTYATTIVSERLVAAQRQTAGRRRSEPPRSVPEAPPDLAVRMSTAADLDALERLAGLDSRRLPAGPFLLAEVDGELVAAAPIGSAGEPISDPFRHTADARALLALRVRQLHGVPAAAVRRIPLRMRRAAAAA